MSSPIAWALERIHRVRFELLYRMSSDPWHYGTSAYEQEKYAATLAALPSRRPLGAVLEVGCSIGVFTTQLAPHCTRVLALDFSPRALALAAERTVGLANVELRRASFPDQAPQGPWDVVVCSEVLYYLDTPALQNAIEWFTTQLEQGACLIAVSWRGTGTHQRQRGDDVHDLLAHELARWHTRDGRQARYRLDCFEGDRG